MASVCVYIEHLHQKPESRLQMRHVTQHRYAGIDNDHYGGMTPIGKIVKDAWLFGVIPATETCENWTHSQLQAINEQVQLEWDKYGCMVSSLPDDLKKRHAEINDKAIKKARELGWDPTPREDEV
jgi:hypothetical protein